MKRFFIVCFLIISNFCLAQNPIIIAGKVVSEEGIIPDAYVMIGTQGTITNNDGLFKFNYNSKEVVDKLKIEVSAIGYDKQEFIFSVKETNLEELLITLNLYPNINENTALKDISEGKIQFLLSGGIAPVIYSSDKEFTKKYNVSFYEYGCEAISNKSLKKYNTVVAKYLDKKYGKSWRDEVRNDLIGIH